MPKGLPLLAVISCRGFLDRSIDAKKVSAWVVEDVVDNRRVASFRFRPSINSLKKQNNYHTCRYELLVHFNSSSACGQRL